MKISKKAKEKIRITKKYFKKWLQPLGLLWWKIDVRYYTDPNEILSQFAYPTDEKVVFGRTIANWMYSIATIKINVSCLVDMSDYEIEAAIVHELCHVLVCEMSNADYMGHEERVVTGLQKAFMWVENEFSKHRGK